MHAVMTAEDQGFCLHHGFDWGAIEKAQDFNEEHQRTRGASTISMQTAKNAFLWPSRSWTRKGVEAYFTVLMELFWPKQRIMEVYLNVAEWGEGVFGAEAAAQHYFGKPAVQLTRRESALLAASLPTPLRSNPARPSGYLRGRATVIQLRMNGIAREFGQCVPDTP
jgi:monofunctional biosynthetic peptidoglycan transglycosylase